MASNNAAISLPGIRVLGDGKESEAELVARAGRGDRVAASALIMRHTDKVMAVCYGYLGERAAAEDVTQETFIRLWTRAAKWKPQGAKFETWLIRIAMNLCIDRIRKHKRESLPGELPEETDPAALADASIIADERRARIDKALENLPERQRRAVALCHYGEMSNIEAARVMQVSVEAVESLLARARRGLRAALQAEKQELLEG